MKKIILLSSFIAGITCASAQQQSLSSVGKENKVSPDAQRIIPAHNEIQSPPFFSEDFSAGIPGTWTNVDNSGSNVLWRTTTTGAYSTSTPVDEQLSTVGTSASNGYLIMDSDSAGLAGTATENTDLTTSAINCSGHAAVHISFSEYFAQFGSSTATVKVSNDNITWVDIHYADAGIVSDSGTTNPYLLDFDISATAANQATVYLRFNYEGANDYWWFVDDVQLYEPSAVDLAVTSIAKLDTQYTFIPVQQATALSLSAVVKNVGLNASSAGTALLELVDAGTTLTVFSENVSVASLAPGSSQTVVPSGGFAPPVSGSYKSRVTLSFPGDVNAVNDVLESAPVYISDSLYQRDDDGFDGVQPLGFGAGADGLGGQNFMVNSEGDLTSITFFLLDTFSFNVTGTPLFFTVHPQPNSVTAPDGASVLGVSDTLMLFDGMIPLGGAYYTLHMQGGALHLTPGLYFIGFHEVDGVIPMGYSNDIHSTGAVWIYSTGTSWFMPEDFGFSLTYMIRANFGMLPDAVSEIPITDQALIYPNPSSGVFRMRMAKRVDDCSVQVQDALGNQVYQASVDGTSECVINLSKLSSGLYSVHIMGTGYSSVQKICLQGN